MAPNNWYQNLAQKVGEMGFDDYADMAEGMFQGGGESQQGGPGGAGFPPMSPPAGLGAVGSAGSEFFASLGQSGGRSRGGLF
jgi:hypothetical protein